MNATIRGDEVVASVRGRDLYNKAMQELQAGQFREVHDTLLAAGDAGYPRAYGTLADLVLHGLGCEANGSRAVELYRLAAEQGWTGAYVQLAGIAFFGLAGPPDATAARTWLAAGVAAGEARALCVAGVVFGMHRADEVLQQDAASCLELAALGGDLFAQHAYGLRRIQGMGVERDERGGRAWLALAAARGLACSAGLLAGHTVEGGGHEPPVRTVSERVAACERLAERVRSLPWPRQTASAGTWLSRDPELRYVPDYLSDEEVDYLTFHAQPRLKPSLVVEPSTGRPLRNALRTSEGTSLYPDMVDMAVGLIANRLATAAGVHVGHGEPLALLRYRIGQEYKPHYDFLTPEALGSTADPFEGGGQRTVTVLAYLNDVPRGGGTAFPRLDITLAPVRRAVVVLRNCGADGTPDPRTLHAGLPVESGEKWLATLWLRERPIGLWRMPAECLTAEHA